MSFCALLDSFTDAVAAGDGPEFAQLFTPDGAYVDGFYGPFQGREAIAHMLEHHFHGAAKDFHWRMYDPVDNAKGTLGYARYLFTYTSTLPESKDKRVVFEGMSRFEMRDGLIAHYSEIFDKGIALTQLGFPEARIAKSLTRWTDSFLESAPVKKFLSE